MNPISRKEATAAGLNKYFTGKPCKRGHLSERFVNDRGCVACQKVLVAEFRSRHPGYDARKAREDRKSNPEKYRKLKKAFRARHPEKVKAEISAWRARNLEHIAEYNQKTKLLRSEQARARRLADPERFRQQSKEWKEKNWPKVLVSCANRRARKRNAAGVHTHEDISEILRMQAHKCAYCRVSLKKITRHTDHITPLIRGGTNDRTNLQILCAPCNLRKNARDPIDFAQSLGMLL